MMSAREEGKIKKHTLLQKKRERDATKKRRKRAKGPREEDQVDEDFPRPKHRIDMPSEENTAHPTSMPESLVLQPGVHPSNTKRKSFRKGK
jgi:hypothetical protein